MITGGTKTKQIQSVTKNTTSHNTKTHRDTPSRQAVLAVGTKQRAIDLFIFSHQLWWVLFTQTSHHRATSCIANKTAPGKNLQAPQDPWEKG